LFFQTEKDFSMTTPSNTIVDVAAGNSKFTRLLRAVKAADLAGALSGEGPFTVFAPTDEAFAKLPPGTLDGLLKPDNKAKLADLLKLHVLSGKVMAADVAGKKSTPASLQGEALQVDGTDGVHVNGAKVVIADIAASNGVIHAIDAVIMPQAATAKM
jgi:uncharacterized surface protein with fasciclin (FAS1) repeats